MHVMSGVRLISALAVTALALTAAQAGPAAAAGAAGNPAGAAGSSPAATLRAKDAKMLKSAQQTGIVPDTVIAVLSGASITGPQLRTGRAAFVPRTSSAAVNTALARFGATSVRPLLSGMPASATEALTAAAQRQLGAEALNLADVVVVHVAKGTAMAAARALAATSGVAYAEPDRYVNTMNTGDQPLPKSSQASRLNAADVRAATPSSSLPGNYGLAASLDSYLNAQGVDVGGAYATLQDKFGQLPGAGETITNVSIGDLTDQSMADSGDSYVRYYGPTTIVQNGQRYLDLPSMPLIPTYVAEPDTTLSATASAEGQDPQLGEVGLDFSVMAPLPHADQRAGERGSGLTDLLGIAPGARYRLVVPSEPTYAGIATAFLAAASQKPAPSVITASLGFGTDTQGFPGRYLEDDPVMETVIASIVQADKIPVVISSGDGTRLYTPAAVGPDGGATPVNVAASPARATSIADDAASTTPSEVVDSGAIAAGATTTDDTLAVSPATPGSTWRNPVYAETRTDGFGSFASGFGQRLTLSAPGDNIPAFEHTTGGAADAVTVALTGGTSASAPEIAAAAAVVLQTARATGQSLTPARLIRVLQQTGHAVATPPQADQPLNVGRQIDVTAAVDAVLRAGHAKLPATRIVRLSVAHRQMLDVTGSDFLENTDPGVLDLADTSGGSSGAILAGEGLVGPVTFAADIEGARGDSYALMVGKRTFTSSSDYIRVTPEELMAAAGWPLTSASSRTLYLTYQVRQGNRVLAQIKHTLVIGPTDGSYTVAQAPEVAPVAGEGNHVSVRYDLTGVTDVASPVLVVSRAGHWSPSLGPVFAPAYSVPLSALSGTVTLPASAFGDGGGIYGVGIEQDTTGTTPVYGVFASVRVSGFAAATRPAAPTLSAPGGSAGHAVEITRSAPDFTVHWNAGRGAAGAILEISAPGPTLYDSLNTFNNPNGTQRDHNGNDSGSLVYTRLPLASGTRTFDALSLGLLTSLSYDVRILPVAASGAVDGQASPESQLTIDDGIVPEGGTLESFAIDGADSVAAITDAAGSQVVHYSPATGAYGPAIATDPSGGPYDIYGVDPAAHTVLVNHEPVSGGYQIELYDTQSGSLIGEPGLSAYTILGGRVDPGLNLAVLLARDNSTSVDSVVSLSMTTGAVTAVTAVDGAGVDGGAIQAGTINGFDLDTSTGQVLLEGTLAYCFSVFLEPLVSVNPVSGTATFGQGGSRCDDYIAADDGEMVSVSYRTITLRIAGSSALNTLDEASLDRTGSYSLRIGKGQALAVDGRHHLALVMYDVPAGQPVFGYPNGYVTDSNAMSEIDVVDTTTGAIVRAIDGFVADPHYALQFNPYNERSIQLDPATKTAYIYSPFTNQIQQFSY